MARQYKVNPEVKDDLAKLLVEECIGRRNVKVKTWFTERVKACWRTLCDAVRDLNETIPVGTCKDGWFLIEHLDELIEVEARERARAMSILAMIPKRRKAFFTFWAGRSRAIAGKPMDFPTFEREVDDAVSRRAPVEEHGSLPG